ncbi:MAG TPA: alpha-amylase family glycosyl hydrolase [Polyangiaceae bacterium]|nr:alpha-amylase family glycosyl hydrolase [Polyangiaceae bacterium]
MLRSSLWRWSSSCAMFCACNAPVRMQPTGAGERQSARTSELQLWPASAELFTFALELRTKHDGPQAPLDCSFRVGSRALPATRGSVFYEAHARLQPGLNQVVASCRDAAGGVIASNPESYDVRLKPQPHAAIALTVRGGEIELSARQSAVNSESNSPLREYRWSQRTRLGGPFNTLGSGPAWTGSAPADGSSIYRLTVTDADGEVGSASVGIQVRDGQPWSCADREKRRELFAGSVLYGVLPPLFGAQPLRAVEQRLSKLAELGVDVLWLAPTFENKAGDFGYAVEDYFRVRSDYGTPGDLKSLIGSAHRLGMRVILDLVPNHTSSTHRYFHQGMELGARSHYFGFYQRTPDGLSTHYFDWQHLPNLDYGNAEVRRFMSEAASYWLEDFDVDGYRVDAAWGIREREPAFFAPWLRQLSTIQPCAWMLAEAPGRDAYYVEQGFDFAYDWGPELGHWAFEEVFTSQSGIAARFANVLQSALQAGKHDVHQVVRFLNNNDTGPRFITRYGLPLTRVATVALFTLPGVPALYSFDEEGAEFEPYSKLTPIVAPPHPELYDFHRKLIALRHAQRELQRGELELLAVDPKGEGLAFARVSDAQLAVVALNFGARPVVLRFAPVKPSGNATRKILRDALHPSRPALDLTRPQVYLGAHDYAVFVSSATGR